MPVGNENVLRLDVAVADAFAVAVPEREREDPRHGLHDVFGASRLVAVDERKEVAVRHF